MSDWHLWATDTIFADIFISHEFPDISKNFLDIIWVISNII